MRSSANQQNDVEGLLFIGDPHLEARVPGFRKDDYPQVALQKFRWSLEYAQNNNLQPILLGDLFQLPQDNPNWLISAIIEVISDSIGQPLPAIYGNHDIRENSLKPNDSIHILFSAGHLRQLSADAPWRGSVAGRSTLIGGTDWGARLPKQFVAEADPAELTIWITHHDIFIPGYEEAGRIRPTGLPGIDLIVNGHVHRRLAPVDKGGTLWITAGNITRRARSDASREHQPAVLCLFPAETDGQHPLTADSFAFQSTRGDWWELRWQTVPHQSFDEVFYPEVQADLAQPEQGSGFVADLRELTARRTDSGAGLSEFLKQHLGHFETAVVNEILRLANEVSDAEPIENQ